MARRRGADVQTLHEHPNLPEILSVLAQVPAISDGDLPRLAASWQNTVFLAEARGRALDPDSPLVVEVLAAFDALQALFADDLAGTADYVTVDPAVTSVALKAVRDAVAAAYARPVLGRTQHSALLHAWRDVYPESTRQEPDLGRRGRDVKSLLAAMPRLAASCHDTSAAQECYELLDSVTTLDEGQRVFARDEAWRAAVLTSRRRMWALVRRSGAEAMGRFCPSCRVRAGGPDAARVLAVCADAACGLLVADALDTRSLDVLTLPVQRLIPTQRPAPEA